MPEAPDEVLVAKTLAGDREAFGRLVARYRGEVHGVAYGIAGRFPDAEDISQEAFVRAWCRLGTLRDPAQFAPWLRRVVTSVALTWLARRRPERRSRITDDLEILERRGRPHSCGTTTSRPTTRPHSTSAASCTATR